MAAADPEHPVAEIVPLWGGGADAVHPESGSFPLGASGAQRGAGDIQSRQQERDLGGVTLAGNHREVVQRADLGGEVLTGATVPVAIEGL